jgi:hypothetical protein
LIESQSTDEKIWHQVGEDEPTALGIFIKWQVTLSLATRFSSENLRIWYS